MRELTVHDDWTVEEGIDDSSRFFRAIRELFPDATLLCVEGTSIEPAVLAVYRAHRAQERNPAPRNTYFPPSKRIACAVTAEFLGSLASLGEARAAPEMLDHLALYRGAECVIEWHDAFYNAFLVNGAVPESVVAALAEPFGVKYSRR